MGRRPAGRRTPRAGLRRAEGGAARTSGRGSVSPVGGPCVCVHVHVHLYLRTRRAWHQRGTFEGCGHVGASADGQSAWLGVWYEMSLCHIWCVERVHLDWFIEGAVVWYVLYTRRGLYVMVYWSPNLQRGGGCVCVPHSRGVPGGSFCGSRSPLGWKRNLCLRRCWGREDGGRCVGQ